MSSADCVLLANGINLPIVAAWGLALFGPLTLLVTCIECLACRAILKVRFRDVFRAVLVANIVSTLVGGVVFAWQNAIIDLTGIRASIPQFVAGYIWAALLLVFIYFAKSLFVESLIVVRRAVARRIDRGPMAILKALAVGNIISYCVVGPLFYYSTRPTFGNIDLTETSAWTANPDMPVYFIDTNDRFIKRMQADGSQLETLVPFPAAEFLMSEDATAFLYRSNEANLYLFREGDTEPTLLWQTDNHFRMHRVSLSPNKKHVAFAEALSAADGSHTGYVLKVITIDIGKVLETGLYKEGFVWDEPQVSWSRDGMQLLMEQTEDEFAVIQGEPPWDRMKTRSADSLEADELVINYLSSRRKWQGNMHRRDDLEIMCVQGLAGHVRVSRKDEPIMVVINDYGLLKLGLPSPASPSFLPNGSEAILEWWDQLYILDYEQRRLGLLTNGESYILPTPRFRLHCLTAERTDAG
jgi:hypothetical protein